jgi:hypothetical protein
MSSSIVSLSLHFAKKRLYIFENRIHFPISFPALLFTYEKARLAYAFLDILKKSQAS